jgi:predicted nucleic-acid-binding Zn-ribbon protein
MENFQCSKCGSATSMGFIMEKGDYNAISVSAWIEGKYDENSFLNIMLGPRKPKYPITAYRCVNCGYLEFYAKEQQK